jgi:alpha-L-arabinofuranosidase
VNSQKLRRREFLRTSASVLAGGVVFGATRSPLSALLDQSTQQRLTARIDVDTANPLHSIDPNIYGSLTEHIGRCVYDGMYEEGSPLSDEAGFRKDVMAAVREMGVSTIRWPGGNFASGYHWTDGVGPKNARPNKYNIAWYEQESHHFGTDEFVAYCKKVGAEPYICVNLGTGTIEEAANWVEYCNATTNTTYANMRRKNGSEAPHNVKYWGLGNEVYGQWQIGHKNAEDYAKIALEAAKMMKWVDPSIKLVACGAGDDSDWNRTVLEYLTPIVDYISLHHYEGTDDYYELLGTIRKFEGDIRRMSAVIETADPLKHGRGDLVLQLSLPELKNKGPVRIACDEWNIWYRKWNIWKREIPNPVEEIFNLRDALWCATVLNLFHRNGNVVTMANCAQMVNVIAPIFTNKTGMFKQTIFHPLSLYRHECGTKYLRSQVDSPAFSSKSFKDVPHIDVSSTVDEGRNQLALAVVNRHESSPIKADISLLNWAASSTASAFEINGASPTTENSFAKPDAVHTERKTIAKASSRLEYEFPAHSVTVIKFGRI